MKITLHLKLKNLNVVVAFLFKPFSTFQICRADQFSVNNKCFQIQINDFPTFKLMEIMMHLKRVNLNVVAFATFKLMKVTLHLKRKNLNVVAFATFQLLPP
jgi:hypothetical protein